MTKEEIFALELTREQKAMVERSFMMAERTHRHSRFEGVTTTEEAKKLLEKMEAESIKRNAKAQKKFQAKEADRMASLNLRCTIEDAKRCGFTYDDLAKVIKDHIKEAYNAKIDKEIAALQARKLK